MGKKKSIGNREMMILNIVWDKGETSVRDVFRVITENEEIAYTSVMTTMQNMEKKNLLTHREESRTFIYKAAVEKNEVQKNLLNDLLDGVFKGSYENLVTSLIQSKDINPEEIKIIAERLIAEKENNNDTL